MDITYNLLLADDDADDRKLFKFALQEIPVSVNLITAIDGVALMDYFSANATNLPDVLFLDLNMPRKSGFECLPEIKNDTILKKIPIFIFSTSLDMAMAKQLYHHGANYYVKKPGQFDDLIKVIHKSLTIIGENKAAQPSMDNFIIEP